MKTKILLSLLLSFSFYLLSSQVPQGFNYQAIARDGSGNPIVNATLSVRLSILSDSNGFYPGGLGTYIWEETHSNVKTNAYGLFNIVFGNPLAVKNQGTASSFSAINWATTPLYIGTKINNSGSFKPMGAAQLWAVPYAMIAKDFGGAVPRLNVAGTTTDLETALFEVKNNIGQTIFAVYNEGVRIYVDDGSKGSKGGFAIGGFGTKAPSQEYLRVTRDSTRVYVNPNAKGLKGGFAIGGFSGKGASNNFLNLTKENYFIGHASGSNNLNGTYNSFMGYEAGKSNTDGLSNVFIGYRAGLLNRTGSNNMFIGNSAGYSNINGSNNIFLGGSAGYGNTGGVQTWMGSDNIFLGTNAGRTNTEGGTNIFMGTDAGYKNLTGNLNIYIGNSSGFNSTGYRNTFMGAYTGYDNSTGQDNLFIGNQTGEHNTTGNENTFLGGTAGWNVAAGSGNTFIGLDAGRGLVGGSMNVYVGRGAGGNGTAGNRNTYIGYDAGRYNSNSDNIFIGYLAGSNESAGNRLYIENSGADKATSLIYGEFDTEKLRFNANVGVSTDPGLFKLYSIDTRVTSDYPAILGEHNVTPYYGVGVKGIGGYIGVMGESSLAGANTRYGVFGSASGGTTANYGVYGTASGTGAYAGFFNGSVSATGYITAPSDKNLKKNIVPLSGSLKKVLDLQGVNYEWKSEDELKSSGFAKGSGGKEAMPVSYNFPKGTQLGVIAQDVEKVVPELVQTGPDGLKSVDYIKMVPLLIEAIKEQQKQIDELKAQISTLTGVKK
jgi:trimeric autotransporter adhesin